MRYDDVVMFNISFVAVWSLAHPGNLIQKRQRANENAQQQMHLASCCCCCRRSFFLRFISLDRSTCKSLRIHYTHTLIVSDIFLRALFYNFSLIVSVIFFSCRLCAQSIFDSMILFPFAVVIAT